MDNHIEVLRIQKKARELSRRYNLPITELSSEPAILVNQLELLKLKQQMKQLSQMTPRSTSSSCSFSTSASANTGTTTSMSQCPPPPPPPRKIRVLGNSPDPNSAAGRWYREFEERIGQIPRPQYGLLNRSNYGRWKEMIFHAAECAGVVWILDGTMTVSEDPDEFLLYEKCNAWLYGMIWSGLSPHDMAVISLSEPTVLNAHDLLMKVENMLAKRGVPGAPIAQTQTNPFRR